MYARSIERMVNKLAGDLSKGQRRAIIEAVKSGEWKSLPVGLKVVAEAVVIALKEAHG